MAQSLESSPVAVHVGCPTCTESNVRQQPCICRLMPNILEMWFRMLNAPFPSFPSAGAEKLQVLLFAFVTCSPQGQAVSGSRGRFVGPALQL